MAAWRVSGDEIERSRDGFVRRGWCDGARSRRGVSACNISSCRLKSDCTRGSHSPCTWLRQLQKLMLGIKIVKTVAISLLTSIDPS
ncbi:hypothetical protein E2C01_044372 [Portunus trituberculatus]|uniref:Uncharacterized protein n=1 Tax=Portunus trituberculatus TaxID=210409 RepID=A0A5B7FZU9_PORTR|nr:hypothetical protein [Portunus trituberculatus]